MMKVRRKLDSFFFVLVPSGRTEKGIYGMIHVVFIDADRLYI